MTNKLRERERERVENMNYISPMSPLHQSNELFQIFSTHRQQHTIPPDTLSISPSLACSDDPIKRDKRGRCKSLATPNNNNETCNEINNKKIIRRYVERKRRQDMAALFVSLRSLLPHEYLKGKRSISDHMNEGANYIRNLQKKIQELSKKRDALKNLSNSRVSDIEEGSLNSCVTVRPCWSGVEVVISSGLGVGVLPLSRVLQVLVHEGFNTVSCVSTKVDERSLHTIQSQVRDLISVDLPGLQQELKNLVGFSS